MKKYLAKSKLKSVYVENNKAIKVFDKNYNKSDVLYEALNTARVEDAGVNIPKLLEVAVTDGKWSITSEYVEGPTLTQLIEKYPDKADDYIKKMVEYQISFQKKSNPLLLVLKDKMNRQINSIEQLDNSVKYELLTRLNSMKNHTKLVTETIVLTILLYLQMPRVISKKLQQLTGYMQHRVMHLPILRIHFYFLNYSLVTRVIFLKNT